MEGFDGEDILRSEGPGRVEVERDKEGEIYHVDPHYTDERFTQSFGGRTVFLDKNKELGKSEFGTHYVEGAAYSYSDRLQQGYPYREVERARMLAQAETGTNRSAKFFERYIQLLTNDDSVEIVHIIAGVNQATGYSYHVYGYLTDGEKPESTLARNIERPKLTPTQFNLVANAHLDNTVMLEELTHIELKTDEEGNIDPRVLKNLRTLFKVAYDNSRDSLISFKFERMKTFLDSYIE